MGLSSPWWLLSLVPVALIVAGYVVTMIRRRRFIVRFSNLDLLAELAPARPGWRRHAPFALLAVALALLAIGLAGPTGTTRVPRDRATVMLAIDVSESMIATDVKPSRLDASKAAAKDFVNVLPAPINLGLVKFAKQASVLSPPTLDRAALKADIDTLEPEDSTAIGDAVLACLDQIRLFAQEHTVPGDKPPPARIVLMSDGANNYGNSLATAEAAARKAGVPVSTVAFGTDNGTVTIEGEQIPVPADKPALKALATTTGGSFHVAATAQQLRSVYDSIGSQIGYTKQRVNISWRFLAIGLLLALLAAAAAMVWSDRLV
jgi:Ca-activated chloride channel family protein